MRVGIVLFLMLLLSSACRHSTPPRTAPATAAGTRPSPRTQAECAACNGVWGQHGLAQVASCLCRTSDGGKPCRTHSDCQGKCVAGEIVDREVVEAGPPPKGYFIGHCTDFDPVFGCMRMIEQTGPGRLDELPPMLCID